MLLPHDPDLRETGAERLLVGEVTVRNQPQPAAGSQPLRGGRDETAADIGPICARMRVKGGLQTIAS